MMRKGIAFGCALVLTLCGMAVAQQQGVGWHFDMMRNRSYGPSGLSGFVTAWVVTNGGTLALGMTAGTYNYIVDWGDGTSNSIITSATDPDASHTYTSGDSNRVVTMRGTNSTLGAAAGNASFRGVLKWEPIVVLGMANAFAGCSSATSFVNGIEGSYESIVSLQGCWSGCSGVKNSFPDISRMTNVTTLASTWASCSGNTNFFPAVSNLTRVDTLSATWYGCSGIKNGFPEVNTLTNVGGLSQTWRGCSGNTNAFPEVSNLTKVTTLSQTWYDCSGANVRFPLVSSLTNVSTLANAWFRCSGSYFSVQDVLGDCSWITGQVKNVNNTFYENIRMTGNGMPLVTAITNSPGYPTGYTVAGCFKSCTNLTDYATIPAGFK